MYNIHDRRVHKLYDTTNFLKANTAMKQSLRRRNKTSEPQKPHSVFSSHYPAPMSPHNCFWTSVTRVVLLISELLHIKGSIQWYTHRHPRVQFVLLNIIFVRVIHVTVVWSFLLLNNIPFYWYAIIYPFYCLWAFGLFLVWHFKLCCYVHCYTCPFWWTYAFISCLFLKFWLCIVI
jgi:hypothetical protein